MEKVETRRSIFSSGGVLALCAFISTGIMITVNWHAKPYVAYNERQVLLRYINAVIPEDVYDNDIVNDTIIVAESPLLGTEESAIGYRARLEETPTGVVLTAIALNGYSGPITLVVGIDHFGVITGVRVAKHRETPGLGDAIEIERSDWIRNFKGKSLTNPGSSGWKVKRDGGEFDQFTGATITPRAVVEAVHKTLIYHAENRDNLYASGEKKRLSEGVPE